MTDPTRTCLYQDARIFAIMEGMKTIGLIGGMSWESTVPYYRQINEFVKERLGGLHSAKIILHSLNFYEVQLLQKAGDWHAAAWALEPTDPKATIDDIEWLI